MSGNALSDYLACIGRYPLLTPGQEIELGRSVQAMIEAKQAESPTPEQLKIIRRGQIARRKFVEANLGLVVSVAKKYQRNRHTMELLDVIQEGNIGLHRAVDKYDPARGYKFSTYAYWWIRHFIQEAILQKDLLLRLPGDVHDQVIKLWSARGRLHAKLGRAPTFAELAAELKADPDTLLTAIRRSQSVARLDEPVPGGEDGNLSWGSLLADPDAPTPDELLERAESEMLLDSVRVAMEASLDQRSREILLARHGDRPESWKALAERYRLPRRRLQQIELRALNRCRLAVMAGDDEPPRTEGVVVGEQLLMF